MPSTPKVPTKNKTSSNQELVERAHVFEQLIEHSEAAFMQVNKDFEITYYNQATMELFTDHLSEFRKVWEDFKPDKLMGLCIDAFHKKPEHQRKLLADPANLPFQTDIRVGDLIIQLNVTGIFNTSGDYVGNTLEWREVTEDRQQAQKDAEYRSQMDAISRSMAVIEFEPDGTVIQANHNFLNVFGYSLKDIQGKHHRMMCDKSYTQSEAYADFWKRLGHGEFESGEIKRIAKDGSELWLQASYNPIIDSDGNVIKIIKFATDITDEVNRRSLALLEMATPVTKIWDGVLFAPIVGIIDSQRAVDIMNKSLSSIAETQARTLVLDISGVAMVDTAVANHLIKITKAAVLMGCKAIISGISPAIAQTITELGIDLSSIHTTSTIESALREFISYPDTGHSSR